MSYTDEYILDAIRNHVWSGFYSADDVHQLIDDLLEDDADEAMLRAAVEPEFTRKVAAEGSWPPITDCDRLDQAFAALDARGVIALQNAGYTMSDGITEVSEALHQRGKEGVQGYCFYHGQDLERAVEGEGVMLAFGSLDDDPANKLAVGRLVQETMVGGGFAVEWSGDPEQRINLPNVDWKRRARA